jgi:hypothetical protein
MNSLSKGQVHSDNCGKGNYTIKGEKIASHSNNAALENAWK